VKSKHRNGRNGLACPESIAHLWGCPYGRKPVRPSTARLFVAIAGEALACLFHTDWEVRIRRMENILSVIKWRIRHHWEQWYQYELVKLAKKAKESDVNVE
jgi:hypothetical protein